MNPYLADVFVYIVLTAGACLIALAGLINSIRINHRKDKR